MLFRSIKDLVYDIVIKQDKIELSVFKNEVINLETLYESYKQDMHLNILNNQISESSIKIIAIFDDIYHDMSTLIKINADPVFSDKNLFMLKDLYSSTVFLQSNEEQDELSIVYNYHLNKILTNLIDIKKAL